MSDGGYWIDSPENPFNQMSYTRGGGGGDNAATELSNAQRAFAMQGAGASALPHFATTGVAQSVLKPGSLAVVGDNVVKTTGPGSSSASTKGGSGGAGAGSAAAATAPKVRSKGAGSQLAFSGPLEIGVKESGTGILMGGDWWQSNPWWSDAEEWEARYAEPGEWLGGLVVMGIDAAFNIARGIDHVTGSRIVTDRPASAASVKYGDGLATLQQFADEIGGAFVRQDARWSQQLHRQFGTGVVVPMGGF